MIYLDSSVALAHLFGEGRAPPASLWREPFVSSQLLEYEVWTRINARGLGETLGDGARSMMSQVTLIELAPPVLARALAPFPVPLRTLDALHLATIEFLRERGQEIDLASFDKRLMAGALALGIPLYEP